MQEYNEIQRHIDDLTDTKQQERHEAQREFMKKIFGAENDQRHEAQRAQHEVKRDPPTQFAGENRAQRRERERQERRAAKKVTT